ncbi:Isochorismatase [Minicystis rosea]|nr:Isochorismatase [Minicystis rosea]
MNDRSTEASATDTKSTTQDQRTALLLIDIQEDYFPGGKMELAGAEAAARNAARALALFRARREPVIHVRHASTHPGATFLLPGTAGAEISPIVAPAAGETVVEKHFPSSFRGTSLEARLREAGIEQLVIAGDMSSMCIDATVRAAVDLGFACTVLHDACAAPALPFGERIVAAADVHGAFMAALGLAYARVIATDTLIAEAAAPA